MSSFDERVNEIVRDAVLLPKSRREDFIDAACGDNSELRRVVISKLESDPFQVSADTEERVASHDSISQLPKIQNYKVLQHIGRGGMGTVYMAEQHTPVRRRLAIKVVGADTPTKEILARFEAERQALAMMDHNNIAKIFDAGVTNDGRPFFAMELVKGVPMVEYCEANRLTTNERLQLFVQVCHAIQHAHQKGVIHRDIKPSNILITLYDGSPVAKVIDFGLAKAINSQAILTEKTLFTRFGAVVGTLLYMSPEQAEMNALDIDTRSDVYSLGVVLYELLTGSTPIEENRLRFEALDQILRLIREEDPPRPSIRLSESGDAIEGISAQRRIAPNLLSRLLKGDLDWIVMKTLEKERSRRYAGASALAEDVEKFLNDEPIEARPPSFSYRLSKIYRRNRGVFAAALVVASLLIAATSISVWFSLLSIKSAAQERDWKNKAYAANEEQKRLITKVKSERDNANEAKNEVKKNASLLAHQLYISKIVLGNLLAKSGNFQQANDELFKTEAYLRNWEWFWLKTLVNECVYEGVPISADRHCVSENGKWLASCKSGRRSNDVGKDELDSGYQTEIQVFSFSNMQLVLQQRIPIASDIHQILISSDGSKIYFVGRFQDREFSELRMYDLQLRKFVWGIQISNRVSGFSLCEARSQVAFGQSSGISIHDADSGEYKYSLLHRTEERISAYGLRLRWSPSGNFLLETGQNGLTRVWDVEKKEILKEFNWMFSDATKEPPDIIAPVCGGFSSDERSIAIGVGDEIHYFSIFDESKTRVLEGHKTFLTSLYLANKKIVSIDNSGAIYVWDEETLNCTHRFRGFFDTSGEIRFLPNQNLFGTLDNVGRTKIWSLQRQTVTKILPEKVEKFQAIEFFEDSDELNIYCQNGLKKHSLRSGNVTQILAYEEGQFLCSHSRKVAVATNYVVKRVPLSGNVDVSIFDIYSKEEIQLKGHPDGISCAAFNDRGTQILVASRAGTLRLWDLVDRRLLKEWNGHGQEDKTKPWSEGSLKQLVVQIEYHPPLGAFSSATKSEVKFWKSGESISLLENERLLDICSYASSKLSDSIMMFGRSAPGASGFRSLVIKDYENNSSCEIKGHLSTIRKVTSLPDRSRIVTAGSDNTIKLWDSKTGEQVLSLNVTGPPKSVTASSNRIAALVGNEVYVWSIFR